MDLDVTPLFKRGAAHLQATRTGEFDFLQDGLNSLRYLVQQDVEVEKGYRHVLVELKLENMPVDLDGNTQ